MEPRILAALRTPQKAEIRLVAYAAGARQSRHSHVRDSLTLVLRGSLREDSDLGCQHAGALSLVAKPAAFEHENAFGRDGAVTLQAILPRDAGLGRRASWAHDAPACRDMLRLLASLERGESNVDELVRDAVAALSSVEGGAAWLEEARRALEREAMPIMLLARRIGIHPVHLARRFRARFGMSPTEYRTRMRARRAARALLDSESALADIALEAGFSDQPHMSRGVRSFTGMTPRALRGCVRSRIPGLSERG
jgi:AraC family transcriptional regulator